MSSPRPETPPVADHAYELLGPLTVDDDTSGWLLLRVVAALTVGEAPGWSIVEYPGAAEFLDPATVDPAWLPLLAQIVGGRFTAGMTVGQRRAEVTTPSGWTRGRPEHLRAVAAAHLTDGAPVQIRQRYDPGADDPDDKPGHIQVRVRTADLLEGHGPALTRDVLNAIPAWLIGHVEITNDLDYDEGRTLAPDYDAANSLNADYDAARNDS